MGRVMPRPHYKKGDDTARDKLEAAFWDALAEGSYEGISVVGLCRAAGVNKNTFYYHFDNIDELARAAAESLVETQFIYTVIEAIRGDAQLPDYLSKSEFSMRLDRVCLLADDRAPSQLRRMLHDAILRMWSAKLGIDVDGLDLRDRTSLEFVIGGFLGIFAYRSRESGSFDLKDIWGADYLYHAFDIVNKLVEDSQQT
ncbi:MAG: hypothetical protein DBY20_06570 [Coriobacteriia bacterium]|nr:MAG: hypothetical protein DBY20_06570 [Coriobacteriia bacterium]